MCEILASVLGRPIVRLASDEGPALGAAVVALTGIETYYRCEQGIEEEYTVADAVAQLVKFRGSVEPRAEWSAAYAQGLAAFRGRLGQAV